MKKLLYISILGCTLLSAGTMEVVSEGKVKSEELIQIKTNTVEQNTKEYQKVMIKDGGITREVHVEIKDKEKILSNVNKDNTNIKKNKLDKLNSHVGLLVKFKTKPVNLDAFSSKFGLKLKAHMKEIGYYVFENKSAIVDIEIVSNILQSNIANNIMTVKPNWPMDTVLN